MDDERDQGGRSEGEHMFDRVRWAGGLLVLSVLAAGCAPPLIGAPGARPVVDQREAPAQVACAEPGAGEPDMQADPAAVDLDPAAVADAVSYASARGAQSVRVYRRGCLVARSGLDPTNEWSPLAAWSMTKGVVALVAGRAVAQGHLGLDDSIADHLDGLSPQHARITVRHLLTQTSGLRFAWANDLNAAATGDSAARVLTRPFEAEPGTRFIYAQTTVTALVSVVEAAVGEDLQSYAHRELFAPVGIQRGEWRWQRDGSGRTQGFAFLDMSPRAFGRLGRLMLQEGRWGGEQLIDAAFVADGARGTEANPGYGFLWHTNDGDRFRTDGYVEDDWRERRRFPSATPDTFALDGMFNQNVFVIPSLDLVVVRMGLPQELFADPLGTILGHHPSWDHRFFEILLGGVLDVSLPAPPPWQPEPRIDIGIERVIGIGF